MKIIDENGAAIETPDLTLGHLVGGTEPVEHPAVEGVEEVSQYETCLLYTSPSPRDATLSRMPSSA